MIHTTTRTTSKACWIFKGSPLETNSPIFLFISLPLATTVRTGISKWRLKRLSPRQKEKANYEMMVLIVSAWMMEQDSDTERPERA